MLNYYDLLNAIDFAHNHAIEKQYNYFLNKYPHIFKYVDIHSRPASHKDFYIPASIENDCKIYSVLFNEVGCRKIGCFPKNSLLKDCNENEPTSYIRIGNEFFLSCQPACYELSRFIDSEFKNGKCMQMNTEKKIFALFPEKIHGLEMFQPMHSGLDLKNGDLAINQDYCTAFGLSFENNECIAPLGQEIAEFFLGSTVYKSLKKVTIQSNVTLNPPAVPDDVKNLNSWLEGSQRMKNSSTYQSKNSIPYIPNETSSSIIRELFKDIVTDNAVDYGLDYTLHVMKNRIPKSIVKFSNMAINKNIIKSAMIKTITQSHVLTFAKVSKTLFSTLSKVNVVMSIFGIISNVIDMFDPFNYNYVLDKEIISKVNKQLDYAFYKSNNRNVEITPEKIWNILEHDMSVYIESLEKQMTFYLEAVKLEDYNSRIKIQKEIFKKNKIKTDWHKVFHVIFVMILIITSVLFIQYFAYFILIYFMFILVYPPSFY